MKAKIYNSFSDKHGNQYAFTNYIDFATFWFRLDRRTLQTYFPDNFYELNKAAVSSREARKPIY